LHGINGRKLLEVNERLLAYEASQTRILRKDRMFFLAHEDVIREIGLAEHAAVVTSRAAVTHGRVGDLVHSGASRQ